VFTLIFACFSTGFASESDGQRAPRWASIAPVVPPLFVQAQRGKGVLYGACGGVWVMILFAPPIADDMALSRLSLKATQEKHPAGFPTLTWVLPGAGYSMDAEARKAAAVVTQEFSSTIAGQATLIEGSGFQSAAVRAIISGIDMMARSRAPKKVFAELRPCADWCVARRPWQGEALATAAEITAALEAVRLTFA